MAPLSWADLTATERRLCAAAAEGQLLDLTTGRADEDDPAGAADWDAGRSIRAHLLHQLLTGRGELDAKCGPAVAVRARGARIEGPLLLTGRALRCPLELRDCHLDKVDLTKAIGPDVSLAGSHLAHAMDARRLRLEHDLDFTGATCRAGIILFGAHFNGNLEGDGATLANQTGPALSADRLTVDGDVFLRGGFTATGFGDLGVVRLIGAYIGGNLECDGATLTNPTGPALMGDGLTVNGAVLLRGGFSATGFGYLGALRLRGADIKGGLDSSRATLTNHAGPALMADELTVNDAVFLTHGFAATGSGLDGALRLSGAHISGNLECNGATLTNQTGPALMADGLTVDGGVFLRGGFTATGSGEHGAVRLIGAHIGGELACNGATLTNKTGPALTADRLTAAGGVFLTGGFTATGSGEHGAVCLPGAHISGELACSGATLTNKTGSALTADELTAAGGVFLTGGFTATGSGEHGAVCLPGAHISGLLACSGATLTNQTGPVLDLAGATLGPLRLQPRIGTGDTWSVDLSDATYQGIPAGASLDQWLRLLRHHTPEYAAQSWQQLAAVHRAAGHERDARRILVAQQDDRRARPLQPKRDDGWRTRASLWAYRTYLGLLKGIVGYGYQTWRALIALLLVLICAAGLGLLAGHTHINDTQYVAGRTKSADPPGATAITTNQGRPCSTVEQIGLGVDLGLPLIKTNVRTLCDLNTTTAAGQWITTASWGLEVLSWAAATLVIAGYTGVVRRT